MNSSPWGILTEVTWLLLRVMSCFKMFTKNKDLSAPSRRRGQNQWFFQLKRVAWSEVRQSQGSKTWVFQSYRAGGAWEMEEEKKGLEKWREGEKQRKRIKKPQDLGLWELSGFDLLWKHQLEMNQPRGQKGMHGLTDHAVLNKPLVSELQEFRGWTREMFPHVSEFQVVPRCTLFI